MARGGWWVSTRREYHSNIMGRHSYLDVRAARRPTRAFFERVDLLAALDAETLVRQMGEVKPGGVLVYDPDAARLPLSKLGMLDGAAYQRIAQALGGGDPQVEKRSNASTNSAYGWCCWRSRPWPARWPRP